MNGAIVFLKVVKYLQDISCEEVNMTHVLQYYTSKGQCYRDPRGHVSLHSLRNMLVLIQQIITIESIVITIEIHRNK